MSVIGTIGPKPRMRRSDLSPIAAMDEVVTGLVSDGLAVVRPTTILAGVVLTLVFSEVVGNMATTVLITPSVICAAETPCISHYPLLMGVAISAFSVFSTSFASLVNTLVRNPGADRITDFVKVGVLLQGLVFALTVAVVPRLFPFQGGRPISDEKTGPPVKDASGMW